MTDSNRDTQNKNISDSFRGILRITNVSDVTNIGDDFDTFSNNKLYATNENNLNPQLHNGFIQTFEVLNGKSKRYQDGKIPVTDSMGNFLYWNIGKEGISIGSKVFETTGQTILSTTDSIISNFLFAKSIFIKNDSYNLLFEPSDFSNNTIIGIESVNEIDNVKNIKIVTKNLEDYINEKLKEYDDSKAISQIPTGSIIHHHALLQDWENNEVIKKDYYDSIKDDYLFCDGKSYTIKYIPNKQDELFDLFFTIGYNYTENKSDEEFQNDLIAFLSFNLIYNYVNSNPNTTVNEVKDYLKITQLPEEYIFNLQSFDLRETSSYFQCDEAPGIPIGIEIKNFELATKLPQVEKFIQDCISKNLLDDYTITFQVPSFKIPLSSSTTFLGSTSSKTTSNVIKWENKSNDFIIPHRHFIALSRGSAHNVGENTYTIIFEPYNSNNYDQIHKCNQNPKNESDRNYDLTRTLDSETSLVAEHCDFSLNLPQGLDIYNDSYILRDVPMTLSSSLSPSDDNEYMSTTLYGGFDTLILRDSNFVEYNFGEEFTDDLRFRNTEPNRGLSGDAIFDSEKITETISNEKTNKMKINENIFCNNFFSMENVSLLPLIKK